jgi:hypothetical protein
MLARVKHNIARGVKNGHFSSKDAQILIYIPKQNTMYINQFKIYDSELSFFCDHIKVMRSPSCSLEESQ